MAMKIMVCFPLLLIAGCMGPASVSSMAYGDKEAFVSLLDAKPYVVIVTDGKLHGYGVSAGPFIPPHFMGTLVSDALRLPYSAQGRQLSIGDNKYDLSRGCLFAVSMTKTSPVIRQFDLSQRMMLKAFLESDAELREFFRDSSPK